MENGGWHEQISPVENEEPWRPVLRRRKSATSGKAGGLELREPLKAG
jgi:hypothetical protein